MGNGISSGNPRKEGRMRPIVADNLTNKAIVSGRLRAGNGPHLARLTPHILSQAPTHVYYPITFDDAIVDAKIFLPPHMMTYLQYEKEVEYTIDIYPRHKVKVFDVNEIQLRIENIDPIPERVWEIDKGDFIESFLATYSDFPFGTGQCPPLKMSYQGKTFEIHVTKPEPSLENCIYNLTKKTKIDLAIAENVKKVKWLDDFINKSLPSNFKNEKIGGYETEIQQIVAGFFSRGLPDAAKKLGIKHIKGILLYGPVGIGKTSILNAIANLISKERVKRVNGTDLLSPNIGTSEANIRKLFNDAEEEILSNPESKSVFLVVIDEIDAIARTGGGNVDGASMDRLVAQLASCMDGVDKHPNIVVLAATNKPELIDSAIMRPGRFDLKIEIGLPNLAYRLDILNVLTEEMRASHALAADVNFEEWANKTKNFTPAELSELVDTVGRQHLGNNLYEVKQNQIKPKLDVKESETKITNNDFAAAYAKMTPAFGLDKKRFHFEKKRFAIYNDELSAMADQFVEASQDLSGSNNQRQLRVLITGDKGAGKSEFSKYLAMRSGMENIVTITADDLIALNISDKVKYIRDRFNHALQTEMSVILIDELDNILLKSDVNADILRVQLEHVLTHHNSTGQKSIVIVTTSDTSSVESFKLNDLFDEQYHLANIKINTREQAAKIIGELCGVLGFQFVSNKEGKSNFDINVSVTTLRHWIDSYCMHHNRILELDAFNAFVETKKSFRKQYQNVGLLPAPTAESSNPENDRSIVLVS